MEESLRQEILRDNMEVLYYLAMQPGNLVELLMGIFVGIVVLTFVLSKVHALAKAGSPTLFLTLFVVILSLFILIEAASVTRVWLLPRINLENYNNSIVTTIIALCFLFLVVPTTLALLRSKYFASMCAWFLGAIAACIGMYFVSLTYEAPREGPTPVKTFEKIKKQVETKIEETPSDDVSPPAYEE
ncbi:MAG: hypothetical protein AAF558_09470 [Verrucomicrobiota bacterium]